MNDRIVLKTPEEIDRMREAGRLLREVMDIIFSAVEPGVTTLEIDRLARSEVEKRKAKPAFLGLYGFPGTVCISVNEQIVHGIPSERRLQQGDIVSLDIGLIHDDFYADAARTLPVGRIDADNHKLLEVTEGALDIATQQLRPGRRLGDLSSAVQKYVESNGLSVVREYTGHGIGRRLHEEPKIPNHGEAGRGIRWKSGMVVCVEPMVNLGSHETLTLEDNWTVVTKDGSRSAHMENTIAITEDGPEVLTA